MKRIIAVSIVLLVTFSGMAGNSKKRTAKVAAPSASAGAYVVTSKPVLGAVRTGGGGGYCACAKSQVFGEKVRESRSNRKRGQVKHYGVVGFICAKCGKVNKAMYAKAKALKAKQTGEGVPTFWMDLQLQQLEQIRQMGDMSEEDRQKMAEAMVRSLQSAASPKP